MKIGIIGSGRIGGNVGLLWARQGHEVMFSSRKPQSLAELVEAAGPTARAGTPAEAAAFGEVVLIAIPWSSRHTLPSADLLAGKIVIDAMNPIGAHGVDLGDSTSAELVAKQLPGARLVKAFNTMYFETLRSSAHADHAHRLAMFMASDDADAKAVVGKLIDEIGFAPVDTGALREGGRHMEPGAPLFNRPMSADQARALLAGGR